MGFGPLDSRDLNHNQKKMIFIIGANKKMVPTQNSCVCLALSDLPKKKHVFLKRSCSSYVAFVSPGCLRRRHDAFHTRKTPRSKFRWELPRSNKKIARRIGANHPHLVATLCSSFRRKYNHDLLICSSLGAAQVKVHTSNATVDG